MAINSILVDGTRESERRIIVVNAWPIPLREKSFSYFAKLAFYRGIKEGWVNNEVLEQGFNQARYLYRMKKEILERTLDDWGVYENDRRGNYRLCALPEVITFNHDVLAKHDEYDIRKLFTEKMVVV